MTLKHYEMDFNTYYYFSTFGCPKVDEGVGGPTLWKKSKASQINNKIRVNPIKVSHLAHKSASFEL